MCILWMFDMHSLQYTQIVKNQIWRELGIRNFEFPSKRISLAVGECFKNIKEEIHLLQRAQWMFFLHKFNLKTNQKQPRRCCNMCVYLQIMSNIYAYLCSYLFFVKLQHACLNCFLCRNEESNSRWLQTVCTGYEFTRNRSRTCHALLSVNDRSWMWIIIITRWIPSYQSQFLFDDNDDIMGRLVTCPSSQN